MNSFQTWTIKGRTYTHAQILAMRKEKEVKVADTPTEDKEWGGGGGGFKPAEGELPTDFHKLKELAKEKGMEVKKTTKKEEIIDFLAWN